MPSTLAESVGNLSREYPHGSEEQPARLQMQKLDVSLDT